MNLNQRQSLKQYKVMKKISVIEMTLVVDNQTQVEAVKEVLESNKVDHIIDGTDIVIREQMPIEAYAKIVHLMENAI